MTAFLYEYRLNEKLRPNDEHSFLLFSTKYEEQSTKHPDVVLFTSQH